MSLQLLSSAWKPFLVALVLRLAVSLLFQASGGDSAFIDYDSFGYRELGRNLAEHGVYAFETEGQFLPGFHRTPGLPALIAALRLVTSAPLAVCVFQGLVDAFAVFALFGIVTWCWSDRAPGMVAAWLYALSPGPILMANQLMTESLATSVLIFAVAAALVGLARGQVAWLVLSSLLVAASAYLRPSLHVAVLFVVAAAVGYHRNRRTLGHLAVAVAVCMALLAPWVVRNHALVGRVFFSPLGEVKVIGDAADLRALLERTSHEQAIGRFARDLGQEVADETAAGIAFKTRIKTDPRLLFAVSKLGARYIAAHPLSYLRYQMPNTARALVVPHSVRFFDALRGWPEKPDRSRGTVATSVRRVAIGVEVAFTLALLCCAAGGTLRAWRVTKQRWFLVWVVLMISISMIAVGLILQSRYRLMAEPWIWLLASGPIAHFLSRHRAVSLGRSEEAAPTP